MLSQSHWFQNVNLRGPLPYPEAPARIKQLLSDDQFAAAADLAVEVSTTLDSPEFENLRALHDLRAEVRRCKLDPSLKAPGFKGST